MRNKWMAVLYILAILALVFLGVYTLENHEKYFPSVYNILNNPDKYDGQVIELYVRPMNITNESFLINDNGAWITVRYKNLTPPKYGQLAFFGVFKKDGSYIQAIEVRYDNYSYLKYVLSFIGLFIIIIMLFKEWKLTRRGFEDARLG